MKEPNIYNAFRVREQLVKALPPDGPANGCRRDNYQVLPGAGVGKEGGIKMPNWFSYEAAHTHKTGKCDGGTRGYVTMEEH